MPNSLILMQARSLHHDHVWQQYLYRTCQYRPSSFTDIFQQIDAHVQVNLLRDIIQFYRVSPMLLQLLCRTTCD